MRDLRKITAIMILTVIPLSAAYAFALASRSTSIGSFDSSAKIDLKKLEVLWIGSDKNYMLDNVLNRLQLLNVAQMKHLENQNIYSNNSSKPIDFQKLSLVILDGNWISEHTKDVEVHKLLREASYKEAKLVAVGGLTSKFFEALNEAEINVLARDENGNIRNPAYFNPPIVGFKLKQATTPYGSTYSYPSIFASNTDDFDTMFQGLINWLGG